MVYNYCMCVMCVFVFFNVIVKFLMFVINVLVVSSYRRVFARANVVIFSLCLIV